MSAWPAFGFGILLGAVIFDQLWRYVRRLERQTADLRDECRQLAASAIEARRAATEDTGAVHESVVGAAETPNTSQGTSHG